MSKSVGSGDGPLRVVVFGSGFVGSAIASTLASRPGVAVDVLDIPTHPSLARRDAEAASVVAAAVVGAAAVVNTSGRLRGTDEEMLDANVAWPEWLAEQIESSGVRFVHLGSAAEYGDPGSADPVPETAPVDPRGIYGESKWAGTQAVLEARDAGLDAVVARGFNLVGPHLAPVSPLHQFVTDVTALPPEGGEVELWWPDTIRDFILLDDLAEAVARLVLAPEVPDLVNLCCGVAISFREITEAIAARQGKAITIRSLDRPGIPAVVGDNARLREVTGLDPHIDAPTIAERASV
jgi:nucleoside-diphosphate-sugar epimerase